MLVALTGKDRISSQHRPLLGISVLVVVLLILQGCSNNAAGGRNQEGQHEQPSGPHAVFAANIKGAPTPTYEPCDPPCWRGIIPGKSTDLQVQALVEHMPGYE